MSSLPRPEFEQLVYYSLAITEKHAVYERQWIRSIRSLRRHNSKIPVSLFVFNTPPDSLLGAAETYQVNMIPSGNYGDYMSADVRALRSIPTLHKLLPLEVIDPHVAQILYLDCDTFFPANVELLFPKYRDRSYYAREEPYSRRSVLFPYNPQILDEDVLAGLAEAVGAERVQAFNSGVFLLSGSVRAALSALRKDYFSLAWRLAAGASLRPDLKAPPELRSSVSQWLKSRGSESLAYPSNNFWILDQIALWLTLGQIPNLLQGKFSADDVLQGPEFAFFRSWQRCTVVHYFSGNESLFFSHPHCQSEAQNRRQTSG